MKTAFFVSGLLLVAWFFGIHHRIFRIFKSGYLSPQGKAEFVNCFHVDLLQKILELKKNPFMSDQKWRELLPVCRYSDELSRRVYPKTRLISLEELVMNIIQDPEEAMF